MSGKVSATYSAMASVSHTARPSSTSTGTRPTGFTAMIARLKSESGELNDASKRTITSLKGMSACLSSTQGRMDQDE